jgi:FkbM family methyltransferase
MYSQNQEEEIIIKYFGDYVGTLLSVGENDGITLSNVRALIERGWCGVLVEPSPKAYARLKENCKNYDCIYTYPFALGVTNGTVTLHESSSLINPTDVALVSTIKEQEMDRFRSITSYTPVEVKVFRWKTFLNRLKYKTFDFISIDCEGMDLEVLRQIDLSNTRMVCVEWNGVNKQAFVDVCKDFKLVHENGENLIFAR